MEQLMPVFAALILAAIPFIVTSLTSLLKRAPVFNLEEPFRSISVRLIAAVLSFVSATLLFMLGGDPVAEVHIEELVVALYTWLGALGGHNLLKRKEI